MDKLETFFIKIVETAQQQLKPTSGAFSTTKIGEFLTGSTPIENILDKLVSAPVSQPVPQEQPAGKQQPGDDAAANSVDGQIQKDILDRLTARSASQNSNEKQTDISQKKNSDTQ